MDYNDFMKVKGRIFDIQRYSIHDGPGIRTIVFLKGCFMRCKWCCNPESQNFEFETMNLRDEVSHIGQDITVDEVMSEVMKDYGYYRQSGGGMTLSGGEALFQIDFAQALLEAAKYHGINTAIESTGIVDFNSIEEKILPYLDLMLMDIKHVDDEKHRKFTSKSNKQILENAKKIAESGQKIIIRTPVIPTFNNTEEEIYSIAKFASSLPGVEELHILPYHRLGMDKYVGLNRGYGLSDLLPPSNEEMERLKSAAAINGLSVQIGG